MQKDSNALLVFLIILGFLTFTRSVVYIVFSENILVLNKETGIDITKLFDIVLLIFAIIRATVATIILSNRGIRKDMLTFVLMYLVFSSLQRFYLEYLYINQPHSEARMQLDKIQDVNTLLILLSSFYIIKYVFFP
jgi:hypothetical protein